MRLDPDGFAPPPDRNRSWHWQSTMRPDGKMVSCWRSVERHDHLIVMVHEGAYGSVHTGWPKIVTQADTDCLLMAQALVYHHLRVGK